MFSRLGSLSQHARKAAVLSAAAGGAGLALYPSATKCSGEDHIPSLDYGWSHHGALASFDYASVRRGFQVNAYEKKYFPKKIKIYIIIFFLRFTGKCAPLATV